MDSKIFDARGRPRTKWRPQSGFLQRRRSRSRQELPPKRQPAPRARAGIELDLEPMWQAWRRLRDAHQVMLVEGIGGLLCPVTLDASVADLAKAFGLPLLVVARPGLGAINHTALTVEAARARGLKVSGIVINRYNHDSPDLAEVTNPDEIQRVTGVPVLGLIPEDATTNLKTGVVGQDVLAAVRRLPLERLFG